MNTPLGVSYEKGIKKGEQDRKDGVFMTRDERAALPLTRSWGEEKGSAGGGGAVCLGWGGGV